MTAIVEVRRPLRILNLMRMGPHMMMPGDSDAVKGKRLQRSSLRRAWHFARPYRRTIALFLGAIVLAALVEQSEAAGIWTLQAGIFPENAASVHLHEQAGFRVVGRRERIGQMHGVWRDVLLMERRSRVVDWLNS